MRRFLFLAKVASKVAEEKSLHCFFLTRNIPKGEGEMETVAAEVCNDRLACKAIFQLDSASHNTIIYLIFI